MALLFWATEAPESRTLLDALGRQNAALSAAGVHVLAISVDAGDREGGCAQRQEAPAASRHRRQRRRGTAPAPSAVFDRREDLPLPVVFLINGKGEIVKIYRSASALTAIAGDVAAIRRRGHEAARSIAPVHGHVLLEAGRAQLLPAWAGAGTRDDAAALVAFEHVAKVDPSAITFYNLGTLYMRRGPPRKQRRRMSVPCSSRPTTPTRTTASAR